ncbi:hypothetical protein CEH05_07285 [Halobacillus halophilus]|uniref:hypothetical protein n=1 Tax=Halobacillus halophilus TaxID=1570 RepID=UPI0005A12813|nr:hypothetical protein [Halobacillus halophilus]ASF38926.1 hypothetical protein CEH05_07285 [Halobacillus halophilus]
MDLIFFLKSKHYHTILFTKCSGEMTTLPLATFKNEQELLEVLNIKPELVQYFPYEAEPYLVFIETRQSVRVKLLASSPVLETT